MPSHLSSIGFSAQAEALERYIARAAVEGEAIAVDGGRYVKWPAGQDAQLWLQVSRSDLLVGLNPHFTGQGRMHVGLTSRVTRSGDNVLDGAFHGWANPDSDDANSGAYPLVFDTPDHDVYRAVKLPIVLDVQLSSFAHRLDAYPSDEAFYDSQQREPKFAAESFIPSGLFKPTEDAIDPPRAYAIFTGHVLRTALLTNPATEARFHWAWVRTLGGEVDVVADPEVLNGRLVEGGVVSGSFWLSGQLPDYPPAPRNGM